MEMKRQAGAGPRLSIAYGIGMALVFLGQRILSAGASASATTAAGVVVLIAVIAGRAMVVRGAGPDWRLGQRVLLGMHVLGLAALVLYFASSDVLQQITGKGLDRRMPSLDAFLELLWPGIWLAASLPVPFIEMALASMRKAPVADRERVRAAAASGLAVSCAITTAMAIGYAGKNTDIRKDLSYFRTAKSGESTQKLVSGLNKPVRALLFFPRGNEVGEEVQRYFDDLTRLSPLFTIERYDHALEPGRGRDFGVTGNGIIVIARDQMSRQIGLSTQLERAREDLRKLDREVHKHLIAVSRPPRVAYFTQGHEESPFELVDPTDRRRPIGGLKDVLADQGFEVRELSIAQGLATEVPGDASVVLVIGPRRPFLDEEVNALHTWVKRGGRLLIALEPESGLDFANLVGPVGVRFTPRPLANDVAYWRRTSQPSDKYNLATSTFGTHVAVTALSKMGARAPLVFIGAGPLERMEKLPPDLTLDMTVQSDPNTWVDGNINFENDEGEARKTFDLAVAATFRAPHAPAHAEGRVLVTGDSDVFTNIAMQSVGNAFLFLDGVRWLGGEEAITGAVNSEEDVRIAHTRKQDMAWFYISIFVLPAAVIGTGVLATRKRRAGRTREARKAAAAEPKLVTTKEQEATS